MKYFIALLIGLSTFIGQRHPYQQTRSQWCFQIPSEHVRIFSCHPTEVSCTAQREYLLRDSRVHDLTLCVRRIQQ